MRGWKEQNTLTEDSSAIHRWQRQPEELLLPRWVPESSPGDERGGEGGSEVQRAVTALQKALKPLSLSELNKTNLDFFPGTHPTKQTWISFWSHLTMFLFSPQWTWKKNQGFSANVGMWGEGNGAKRRGSQDSTHQENLNSTSCKHCRFSWCWELWAVLIMSPAAWSDKWHFTALWIYWWCMAGTHLDNTHVLKLKHVLKHCADHGSEKLLLWVYGKGWFTVFQSTAKDYHLPPQWTLCIWNDLSFLHQFLKTSGTRTNPSLWHPEWKLLKLSKGHYDWNIQSDDATIRIMKPLEDLLHWV